MTQKLLPGDLVYEIMKDNALAQIFVVEAIRCYAEDISALPIPMDDPTSIINPPDWHALATTIHTKLEMNYSS